MNLKENIYDPSAKVWNAERWKKNHIRRLITRVVFNCRVIVNEAVDVLQNQSQNEICHGSKVIKYSRRIGRRGRLTNVYRYETMAPLYLHQKPWQAFSRFSVAIKSRCGHLRYHAKSEIAPVGRKTSYRSSSRIKTVRADLLSIGKSLRFPRVPPFRSIIQTMPGTWIPFQKSDHNPKLLFDRVNEYFFVSLVADIFLWVFWVVLIGREERIRQENILIKSDCLFVTVREQSGFYIRSYFHDFEFIFFGDVLISWGKIEKKENSGLHEWSFYYFKTKRWSLRDSLKMSTIFLHFFPQYCSLYTLYLFIYSHWDLIFVRL